MAFRATNIVPQDAYDDIKAIATSLKAAAAKASAALATDTPAQTVLAYLEVMKDYKSRLSALKDTTGLADYAKEQESDPTYDVAAEFVSLMAVLDTAIASLVASFPVDGSGYLLDRTFDAEGALVQRVFTAAQLAGVKADVDAVASQVV